MANNNLMLTPAEEFYRCPSCIRKFANEQSFEAHRAHGRCIDPNSLGQHEVYGVFYIPGTAAQVNPWVDIDSNENPAAIDHPRPRSI